MADNAKPWTTEDPNIFLVGGKKFYVLKRGREQAVQIEKLNGWLKQHIAPLSQQFQGAAMKDNSAIADNVVAGWSLFSSLTDMMTADAQMELARTVMGENKDVEGNPLGADFLENHYGIDWVTDALEIIGKNASVQRLITSFFTNLG